MGKFDGVARADWLLKLLWVKQVYTALTVAHNEPLVRQKNRAARRLVAQRGARGVPTTSDRIPHAHELSNVSRVADAHRLVGANGEHARQIERRRRD